MPISSSAAASFLPKEAKIISLLLKNHGIDECEPKVVQQLIDFGYRHATDILHEAVHFAEHANRTDLALEDVRLATQTVVGACFVAPPSRQTMADVAAERNAVPLPPVDDDAVSLRLPSSEFCLLAPHYRITSVKAPAGVSVQQPSSVPTS